MKNFQSRILLFFTAFSFLAGSSSGELELFDRVSAAYPDCDIREVNKHYHSAGAISSQNYPWPYPNNMDKCFVIFSPYNETIGLYLSDVDMECGKAGIKISKVSRNMTRYEIEGGICQSAGRSEDEKYHQNTMFHVLFYSNGAINWTKRGANLHYFIVPDDKHLQWTWYHGIILGFAIFIVSCCFGMWKHKKARAIQRRQQAQLDATVNTHLPPPVPPPTNNYALPQQLPGQQYSPGSYPTQAPGSYPVQAPPPYPAAAPPNAAMYAPSNQYGNTYGIVNQETSFST